MKTQKQTLVIMAMAIMAVAVALVSCKKKKTDSVMQEPQTLTCGMLHFNSAEEFLETQQKVLSMSETERRNWEQQKGFKSYATKCEELFEQLESMEVTSSKDIYTFVKENSDCFYLCEENGEMVVRNYLYNSPYYLFVNENQLLQFGNQCLKVYDEGVIFGPVESLSELRQIEKFEKDSHTDEFVYIPLHNKVLMESQQAVNNSKTDEITILGNSLTYKGLRATRKSWSEGNRNTIELLGAEVYIPPMELIPGQYFTHLYLHNYPEHRVAGIWYPCNRRKNYNVNVKWNWSFNNQSHPQDTILQITDLDGGAHTRTIEMIPFLVDGFSFSLFKGTAYTYDTPYMTNFNSSLSNFGL